MGKSGASWVTQALLLALGSISAAMPMIAAIFGGVVTSFFFAVNGLRKEMVVRAPNLAMNTYLIGVRVQIIIIRITLNPKSLK